MVMIPAATERDGEVYVNAADVRRRFPQFSHTRLYRGAAIGQIKTNLIPGTAPLYRLADVERIAAEGTARGKVRSQLEPAGA